MTQNDLGCTLFSLGEREPGTIRLEQALTAFREALKERTRERVPLEWAATQGNMGNALSTLGERKRNAAMVCDGLSRHVGAWEVFSDASRHEISLVSKAVKQDITTLKRLDQSTYSQCIAKYSDILKRMKLGAIRRVTAPAFSRGCRWGRIGRRRCRCSARQSASLAIRRTFNSKTGAIDIVCQDR